MLSVAKAPGGSKDGSGAAKRQQRSDGEQQRARTAAGVRSRAGRHETAEQRVGGDAEALLQVGRFGLEGRGRLRRRQRADDAGDQRQQQRHRDRQLDQRQPVVVHRHVRAPSAF